MISNTFYKIIQGNSLEQLKQIPNESIDCCITSPPYWHLRDYNIQGQFGLEDYISDYIQNMTNVFSEVYRVLKKEGTLWLNIGDTYFGGGNNKGNTQPLSKKQGTNKGATGQLAKKDWVTQLNLKNKDLCGIPWRLAFSLQKEGWYLRQDIIWEKPNVMPESVVDRCVKSHEYVFLLSKSKKYYFNHEIIKEDTTHAHESKWDNHLNGLHSGESHLGQGSSTRKFGSNPTKRNKRSVWSIHTQPLKEAHFATFPEKLIQPMVLAGCPENGVVLDPFLGSGTTIVTCLKNNRSSIGIELNPEYIKIAENRINKIKELLF